MIIVKGYGIQRAFSDMKAFCRLKAPNPTATSNIGRLRAGVVIASLLMLVACGTKDKIVSRDDSADYKSARSLPPLKKPSPATRQTLTVKVPDDSLEEDESSAVLVEDSIVVEDSLEAEGSSTAEGSLQAESSSPADGSLLSANGSETFDAAPSAISDEQSVEYETVEPALDGGVESNVAPAILAEIITPRERVARLRIQSGFDSAWNYLADELSRSGITVFARNQAAGKFSIGCSNINESTEKTKKGRWSIFKRQKTELAEYCALQLSEIRGATVVSVINRQGDEVSKAAATLVLEKVISQ